MWRSWETQYSSADTVLENIPPNLSPSRVSSDTQNEATLIQSSMQWELRLRVLLVWYSKRLLIPSSVSCAPVSYGLPSSTLTVPSFCAENYRQKGRVLKHGSHSCKEHASALRNTGKGKLHVLANGSMCLHPLWVCSSCEMPYKRNAATPLLLKTCL